MTACIHAVLAARVGAFTIHYRYRERNTRSGWCVPTPAVTEQRAAVSVTVDGVAQDSGFIRLVNDRIEHDVEVRAAESTPAVKPNSALA